MLFYPIRTLPLQCLLWKVIEKYMAINKATTVTFDNKKAPFFRALKEKVDNYFTENNIKPTGNRRLYIKTAVLSITAISIYTTLVFFTPPVAISVILCALFGINLAAIGFNIMHDGGHGSYSKRKWANEASSYFLNVMGANSYYWKIKHNINHHTFTNIEGMDNDIQAEPFMRFHEGQKRYWVHRFQHLYGILLYGLTYFTWIFYEDFQKYFSGKVIAAGADKKMSLKEHFIFWGTKLAYAFIYIILPIMMVGFLQAMVGFMIIAFVTGVFITVVFQLAHVVEGTNFPKITVGGNKIEEEWAIHQVNTTADFATKNVVATWLLGGLNFQIEHHLFPRISHVHYPKIHQFVQETCVQFNIQCTEYRTVRGAVLSHIMYIRRMGRE